MPFRHDAGVFRPNGVSRRNFDGLKTPNPSSFGHRVCIGKKVEAKNPNGVSAKCAIGFLNRGFGFGFGFACPLGVSSSFKPLLLRVAQTRLLHLLLLLEVISKVVLQSPPFSLLSSSSSARFSSSL
jgi:hypothetical protein